MPLIELITSIGGGLIACGATTKYTIDKYNNLTPDEKEYIWSVISNSPCASLLETIAGCFIRRPDPVDLQIEGFIHQAEELVSQAKKALEEAKQDREEAAQNLENTSNKMITPASKSQEKININYISSISRSGANPEFKISPKSALAAANKLRHSQEQILKDKHVAVLQAQKALEEAENTLWALKHSYIETPVSQSIARENIAATDRQISLKKDALEEETKSVDPDDATIENIDKRKDLAEKSIYKMHEYIEIENPWVRMSNGLSNLNENLNAFERQRIIARLEMERLEEQRLVQESRANQAHYNNELIIEGLPISFQPRSNDTHEGDFYSIKTSSRSFYISSASDESEFISPTAGEIAWGAMPEDFKNWWNDYPDSPDGSSY